MRWLFTSLIIILLAGCAAPQQSNRTAVDWDKVQRTEAAALGVGMSSANVIWINYPRKRVSAEEEAETEATAELN